MQTVSIGIFGASGYSGLELTRLLSKHPRVSVRFLTSDRWAGQGVAEKARVPSTLQYCTVSEGLTQAASCDSVLLATPAESSLELAPKLRAMGVRVVDLAGSFRLKNASLYPTFYRFENLATSTLSESVYGLPELFRERLKGQPFIANPGCFATVAALTVAPLVKAGLIDVQSVVISAASGVSGAGRKASEDFGFMEIDGDFRAYRVLSHQHTPEIDQTLSAVAGAQVSVVFTPHLLPIKRGILCTSVATLKPGVDAAQITAAFAAQLGNEPLISLLPSADAVRIADVMGTPRCSLGVSSDGKRVVSVGALDNLLKGAASQAIQNLNLQLGFTETEGLI
jgi:N-acetyl-gamma-glutamyl-phosphate reductase